LATCATSTIDLNFYFYFYMFSGKETTDATFSHPRGGDDPWCRA
jgi:hypothetical protein